MSIHDNIRKIFQDKADEIWAKAKRKQQQEKESLSFNDVIGKPDKDCKYCHGKGYLLVQIGEDDVDKDICWCQLEEK